jgi:hypothetical protein
MAIRTCFSLTTRLCFSVTTRGNAPLLAVLAAVQYSLLFPILADYFGLGLFLVVLFNQLQRCGVDAEAQPCWVRAVVKHVP